MSQAEAEAAPGRIALADRSGERFVAGPDAFIPGVEQPFGNAPLAACVGGQRPDGERSVAMVTQMVF
ncbi:hypothetical protein [Candidatus Poriferisodalis sp.]|uniref:hypothetical protein n=1 Tax=Candidatus Poriferisodalis sp. TaxID=3101277 RepID=UPI003B019723